METRIDKKKLNEAIWEVLNKDDFPQEEVETDIEEILTRYLRKLSK